MKKIVLLLALTAVACTIRVHAQVRLGILGGLHSSKILETNSIPGWDSTVRQFQRSRSGIQAGVIVEVPIGHKGLFFQPAILYSTKGNKYEKNYDSTATAATDTVYMRQNRNLNYIDVPLNLTYKMALSSNHKNFFFISAGPQISFIYGGKITQESLTYNTNKYRNESNSVTVGKGADTYTTFDFGVNGRAGFELGSVLLSAYYSRGLTNFYHAPYKATSHHELLGASLGFWLTSTAAPAPPRKKDTDKDGIPDAEDGCPLQPGSAKWHGCPVPDSDHDGVNDEQDSCKNVAGLARYHGCPIPDSDNDGVNDEEDKCPTVTGLARYQGCPIPDSDGDGVNDEEDKCPDSAGTAANHGCPEKREIIGETTDKINYIAHSILFTSASDRLTDSSYLALDELAAILSAHPEWKLAVEGYTDNSGTPEKNLDLSRKRARAVMLYLVKKGISGSRLSSAGYGQDRPVANNGTPAGRAANRRVELKLSTGK